MAMHFFFFVTFVLSFLNFTAAAPDAGLRILHRRDVCTQNGQVDCYSNCMPPKAVCCSDGSGTYCPSGEYCVPGGCCPNGKTCTGGGGTSTITTLTGTGPSHTATSTAATDICAKNGQVDCYSNCMPSNAVSCSDSSGTYCPSGKYCVPGGCCPNGQTCTGVGATTSKTADRSSPTQSPPSTTGTSHTSNTTPGTTP